MALTPNPDNYTLGRGIVYFDKKDPTTGLYEGERDLGNAPAFTFSIDITSLEHFSSRSGLKAKDKRVITEVTPKFSFTLDEPNAENFALLTMADIEEISQIASDAENDVFSSVTVDRWHNLDKRDVSIRSLNYKASGAPALFAKGETVTGAGGANAEVLEVDGDANTGTLWVGKITAAPFVDGEALTGSIAGDALADGAETADAAGVVVSDNQVAPTIYTKDVDYTIDATRGRIKILSGGAISDGDDISVSYSCGAVDYKKIKVLAQTELEGRLRFIGDVPVGMDAELEIWRASLTPAGETAMIGDDWSTLEFDGEVLKDETGHPESPYMNILMS